jgi:predicted Zn-dependent protease
VDAERLLAQYIQNNQWDRPILGRHIHVLARMGRQAEALKEAEAAVEKYPFDSLIRDWLAKAYEAMGRKNESETQRRIAERLSGKK